VEIDLKSVSAGAGARIDAVVNGVDWSAPWLAHILEVAAPVRDAGDWQAELNVLAAAKVLHNHRGLPVRFVPQMELPADMVYEAFISDTGKVPTRANLHDFFNALVWLAYPQVKRQLNALQAAEIKRSAAVPAQDGAHALRGKLRDGATIFDENAALFVSADPQLAAALRTHSWNDLFVRQRAAFGTACQVRLFGHALMEKLVAPYKAITAHAWVVTVEPAFFAEPESAQRAQLDDALARQLANGLTTADFTPLPILGVPGWWPQQDDAFYADQFVFRPPRKERRADA
jgi:hypothetical protein